MQVTALLTDLNGMATEYKSNLKALHTYKANNETIVKQHKGDYITAETLLKKKIKEVERKLELSYSFRHVGDKNMNNYKQETKVTFSNNFKDTFKKNNSKDMTKDEKLKKFKENKVALEKNKMQKLKENKKDILKKSKMNKFKENKAVLEKSKLQKFKENKKDILGAKENNKTKTKTEKAQAQNKPELKSSLQKNKKDVTQPKIQPTRPKLPPKNPNKPRIR